MAMCSGKDPGGVQECRRSAGDAVKVLLLSRYGPLGASSRYRSYQYLPYLRSHGLDITVQPLLGDDYLRRLYAGERADLRDLSASYARRIRMLSARKGFDLLWIEYEALPWLPSPVESFFLHSPVPYVVDYDDAIFHRYDLHRFRVVRSALGTKIDRIMKNARTVIAGNAYLADRAVLAGAAAVEILPSVIDADRYVPPPQRGSHPFTVIWIGSPSTERYLGLIREALQRVAADGPLRIVVVGGRRPDLSPLSYEVYSFTEENDVHEMWNADVGIMPLEDTPWERGKCGHKLIKYMACGLPVVATPVGVNTEIVSHEVHGFLARTTDEWVASLERLRQDPPLRERLGKEGRRRVEEKYCTKVTAPRLLRILEEKAGDLTGQQTHHAAAFSPSRQ
jgi:glycosyltransferase involved in cell wall biosynthesis